MVSNQNFDDSGFLFGSSLVWANGFLESQGVYLGSAFGTSTPKYMILLFCATNHYMNLFLVYASVEFCDSCGDGRLQIVNEIAIIENLTFTFHLKNESDLCALS